VERAWNRLRSSHQASPRAVATAELTGAARSVPATLSGSLPVRRSSRRVSSIALAIRSICTPTEPNARLGTQNTRGVFPGPA